MNCEVYNRFKEIVPVKRLDEMTPSEIGESINIAFKIIGYSPNNLKKSLEVAIYESEAVSLFQFIYDVYEVDSNGD